MRRTRLKPMSTKRRDEMPLYHELISRLRELCKNRSELSGEQADWQTDFNVEGHHILKRGKQFLNPFGIIMVTRPEHDRISQYPKDYLLALVKGLRIKQGFEYKEWKWKVLT